MNRQVFLLLAITVLRRVTSQADCGGKNDVVFVIDSSDNVGQTNFKKEIDFVKNTVSRWNIGPAGMQVGLVTFGDTAESQFYLNSYSSITDIQNALGRAKYIGGKANTAEAIKVAYDHQMNPLRGARNTSPHTIVLVSNSPSRAKDLTLLESKTAKDNGNIIYTVGVGGGVDPSELSQVSSNPDSRYILRAQNFDSLHSITDYLSTRVCNELPTDPNFLPRPTSCLSKADLVFMLDSSSSVGQANFQKLEGFLKDFVKTVNVGPDAVHVGVAQFSSYPTLVTSLTQYTSRPDILKAVGNIKYAGGGTNTADAIKFVKDNMFSTEARKGVPHIGILITDGRSASTVRTTAEATAAHNAGIGMIAVGVGPGADRLELNAIASDPNNKNVFTVLNYDQLKTIVNQVMTAACAVQPATPSTGTLPTDTCMDTLPNCPNYGRDTCTAYTAWANLNCKKFCGFCHSPFTTTSSPCKDVLDNCPSYGKAVCRNFKPWAQKNCPLYCGLCGSGSSNIGFYGKCYYKGRAYAHGVKWSDGCSYECTCTDGTSGKYQCYNKCPVYYNLPTGCTLVKKSGDCCLQPVCNFKPTTNTFTGASHGTRNGTNVCQYKGKSYYEKQLWEDGCDYICSCTNAVTGAYECTDLCGKYGRLPSNCQLRKDPGACCQKPVCEFSQQHGSFTGFGSISGNGIGLTVTDSPPCKDTLDNCAAYGRDVCTKFQGWSNNNCRKYCNLCANGQVHAGARDRCVYGGKQYTQGQSWKVKCDLECKCENAVYGYYRCINTCPTYNNLPQNCQVTRPSGQCCPGVRCSAGTFLSSSLNLHTIGNGGMIWTGTGSGTNYVPPTLPSGATAQPGTGGTGNQAPSLFGCLYNGGVYAKNQRWNDACSKSCVCLDDRTGNYNCRPRCPSFGNIPNTCTMETDPNDSCCMIPKCTDAKFHPIPAFAQAVNGYGVVRPPSIGDLWKGVGGFTIVQTGSTIPPPTGGAGVFGGIGYCLYKGKQYLPGETWEDGCDYNCVCDDARYGHYKCVDKCLIYTNLPKPYCTLIPDPANKCCKIPFCNFTGPYKGFTGYAKFTPTTMPTEISSELPTPGLPFCVYKGKHYNQGQQWYDGCSYKCVCDDVYTNRYTCLSRCHQYENLSPGCTQVPDPLDPTCCKIPQCGPTPPGTPTPGTGTGLVPVVPTLPIGSVTGTGNKTSGYIGYCDYKGHHYGSGEKWVDGCTYDCTCENAESGDYRCTEKCHRYVNLPANCHLITDFTNPCCKVPRCDFGGKTATISGLATPSQGASPSAGSQVTPTPAFCAYKGVRYSQGQTWTDGCDLNCRCDNSARGLYTCSQRCPTYTDTKGSCRMVTDPHDSCCLIPQCVVTVPQPGTPTPKSGVSPKPGQTPGTPPPFIIPTAVPGKITGSVLFATPTPGAGGKIPTPITIRNCEYKGAQYKQNQKWQDGCDYTCTCTEALAGKYECTELCPRYVNLPSYCVLQKDPAKPCCRIPDCTHVPVTSNPLTPAFTPSFGVSPSPGQTSTPDTGHTPNPLGTPTPGPSVTPRPRDVCVYKGKTYSQGQAWFDGCDYKCECENGAEGVYRCNNRCPTYNSLPAGCTLVADPGDPFCCKLPQCSVSGNVVNKTGYGLIPTLPPGVVHGGRATNAPTPIPPNYFGPTPYLGYKFPTLPPGVSTPYPGYTPTPYPGFTFFKGFVPTPYPGYTPPKTPYPGFKWPTPLAGVSTPYPGFTPTPYPDYTFYPGYSPTPYPGFNPNKVPVPVVVPTPYPGFTFPTVPPGQSTPYPGFTPTPSPGYTFYPGYTPTPYPGYTPYPRWTPWPQFTPSPFATPFPALTPQPNLTDVCVYKGKSYAQGQRWQDGCDYNCVCDNAKTGVYTCTEKCQRWATIPPECQMVPDYLNPCCEKPYCNFIPTTAPVTSIVTGITITTSGTGPSTPIVPNPGVCRYNGVSFPQGATWKDGCDLNCVCEDASTGYYRCDQRCLKYPNPPAGCTMETDPKDSCCKVPVCPPVLHLTPNPLNPLNPSPTPNVSPSAGVSPNLTPHATPSSSPYLVPTQVPGIKTGSGVLPNKNNKDNVTVGCIYGGSVYRTGQKWQDGCQFNCECVNEKTGDYKCLERCVKYTNVPAECQLIPDPKDACCEVTSCLTPPKVTPLVTPHLGSTPTPRTLLPGQTYPPTSPGTPTPQTIPNPKTELCVYKGVPYTQGQQFYDGCDKKCVCENGKTGFYRCADRCPKFKSIPSNCTLVPDPKDPTCCQLPQCIPVPGLPGFSTPPPGARPTIITNIPGYITGKAPVIAPTPTPGPDGKIPTPGPGQTPAPTSGCMYQGTVYSQGQKWQDGCKYNCRCDDGNTGKYTCDERCPSYPQVPPQCTLAPDPKDFCCYISVCDFNKPIATPTPRIMTPHVTFTGRTPSILTPSPGSTLTPLPGSTPGPIGTIAPNPRAFCVDQGVFYQQGQTWVDGCSQRCRCEDAAKNYYTCFDRCPSYQLKPGCVMVTNPDDTCCQIPKCSYIPTPPLGSTPYPGYTTGPTPSLGPGQTPVPNPYAHPSPIPTAIPGVITGANHNPKVNEKYCVYKGNLYKQDQKWQDGCDFNCVCVNQKSGTYRCTERCAKFVNIPVYCVLEEDPHDKCCKKPHCSGPSVLTPVPRTPTPGTYAPGVSSTTSARTPSTIGTPTAQTGTPAQPIPKDVCIYQGKAYTQGQQWYVGCDQVCVCDNAHMGLHSCNARCPTYANLAPNCVMVPDATDPICCKAPKCDGNNATGVIGVITGHGLPPTPTPLPPGQSPSPGTYSTPSPQPVCVYKGVRYQVGQKWQDGCDYDCVCLDGKTGQYKCTDRCPRYPNLPVTCVLAYDPLNPCCKKPLCGDKIPTQGPGMSTPTPQVVTPTLYPGQVPTPEFCVYNGVPFRQGQTWNVGCDKVCRCEVAATKQINCDDRCASFPSIPSGCSLATDPNDKCCHVVNCPVNPGNPDHTIKGVTGTITGHGLPPKNPNPYGTPSKVGCVYHGKTYKQSQTWNDGCTYTCTCVDAKTGKYLCTEKCARFPPLPASCTMVQDPTNVCCKKPYCPTVTPTPQVTTGSPPSPGVSTPSPGTTVTPPFGVTPTRVINPTLAVCIYKGQQYKQGQMWYDGCAQKCKCEDAVNNFHRCQQRCSTYPNIPASCTLMPDPKDSACCEVPNCPIPTPGPGVTPTPGFVTVPVGPKGVITGIGLIPTPKPGQPVLVPGVTPTPYSNPYISPGPTPSAGSVVTPLPRTGCYYKNHVYKKGQTWEDGCDFNCVCDDDVTGLYKCTAKCQKYPKLPSQCVLLTDPKDKCCQVPYCDYVNPTPFATGIPTQVPQYTPTPIPGINPKATPKTIVGGGTVITAGGRGFCVYKGVYYRKGEEWNVDCSKTCRCEDVSSGYYSCRERCPSYDKVPTNCKLIASPTDSCCLVPDCNNFPIGGYVTNPGVTGNRNTTGTQLPLIYTPVVVPGTITGYGGANPNVKPTFNGGRTACIYKSHVFRQGQTWKDACLYNCECIDEARGQYRCTERCPRYYNLPPQCKLSVDPDDNCCQRAVCDFTPTLSPGVSTPTAPTTATTTPTTQTSTQKHTLSVIKDKCIYQKDRSVHNQGDIWSDGCDFDCKCDDASKNVYTCTQKCTAYSSVPSYCHLEPDPANRCCERPVCTGGLTVLTGSNKPTISPTLKPAVQNVIPLGNHKVFFGHNNPNYNPITGISTGGRRVCVYKGAAYHQGQSWEDACTYTCTCQNSLTGLYKCISKCPLLPPLPSYCHLQAIPGQCCQSLTCNVPGKGLYTPIPQITPTLPPTPDSLGHTPTPPTASKQIIVNTGTGTIIGGSKLPGGGHLVPGGQSISGLRGVCVYNNKMYHQGETWKDGCRYQCQCLDERSGYYSCKPLCPAYDHIPSQCYLVKAPTGCCRSPVCRNPSGTIVDPIKNQNTTFQVYGTFTSGFTGFRPGYNNAQYNLVSGGTSQPGCYYKGSMYQQGQVWNDGCDYHCQCLDARAREYTCSPRCSTYTSLPPPCRLEPGQGCCKAVNCNPIVTASPSPTGPTRDPNCRDRLQNCDSYGKDACKGDYVPWAKKNCQAYCNFCPSGHVGHCVDKLSNCAAYGAQSCVGDYEHWARKNCQKTCNYCPFLTSTTPATTVRVSPNTCTDTLDNCASYGNDSCKPPYVAWAKANCEATCGFCTTAATAPSGHKTTLRPITGVETNFGAIGQKGDPDCTNQRVGMVRTANIGWVMLMKGVAGVPGNLYQLWAGNGTANQYNPLAMNLLNTFKGHYKSNIPNHWNECKFDQIKLAIYKGGTEKANIIFNATGATKTNWMDPNRIISSTYGDIKTATHGVFSLLGDPNSGRQFYASSESNGCDAYGWIMVSTKSNCFYEKLAKKPAFYYSPLQTRAHWGFTNPGEGDVMAIMGHGAQCLGNSTGHANTGLCHYKGKSYKTGEHWQDGCDYNCTCVNGASAFYRCTDLCPTFSNLPSGCTIQKTPGECCGSPVCPIFGGCNYKGRNYQQSQIWEDGCDYTCNCTDASIGFYQCKTKCLQWNLPKECTLEAPPAGKCCPVPKCPPAFVITYPKGYKPE